MPWDDVAGTPPVIHWAVRGRPFAGQAESGDLHVIVPFSGGALIGVIDGLGHGADAAAAARAAAEILCAEPMQPVRALVEACHSGIRGSRGLVLSLASIDAKKDELTWIGVGNVEAVIFSAGTGHTRPRERIVPRSGVVGYRLPQLRAATLPIMHGDTLVFASDGIRHEFAGESPSEEVEAFATHLLRTYAKASDDALVLVARYLGSAG